jgi:hypothetical protein
MTSRQYDAIDERVADEIKRLHKRHPRLGHDGLLDALVQQDIHVDPEEFERFMKEHRIRAERPWKPWKWAGLAGWWPFWGSIVHHGPMRRWRLWRK